MAEDKNVEDRYVQLQLLQQQVEQIADYLEKLQLQQTELDTSIEALSELQKTAVHADILAPIANGIFLKAELKDNQRLIVNVGSGVTVEKSIPEVITLLEEQKEKIMKNISEAETIYQQLQEQGKKIYQEVGEAVE